MNNRKSTKRALLTSVMALAMCVVMLIGTTFAWFTDTATANVNRIQSGKLDVALEYATAWKDDGTVQTWADVNKDEYLQFRKAAGAGSNEKVLWEPGCTYALPELRVVNDGNLALKYRVQITGIKTNHTPVASTFDLNDVIEWTISYGGTEVAQGSGEYFLLPANATGDVIAISGHMKDSAGNDYQNLSIEGVSVTVYATQYTYEYDSEDNLYDEDAAYDYGTNGPIASVNGTYYDTLKDAVAAAAAGGTVMLHSNVTAANMVINKSVTIVSEGAEKFEIKGLTGIEGSNVKLQNVYLNQTGTLAIGGSNTTLENVTIRAKDLTYNDGANFESGEYNTDPYRFMTKITGENVRIENCTFDGTAKVTAESVRNYFADMCLAKVDGTNVTMVNCNFNEGTYACAFSAPKGTWELNGCKFSRIYHDPIELINSNNDPTVKVIDCDLVGCSDFNDPEATVSFENCRFGRTEGHNSAYYGLYTHGDISLKNCKFTSDYMRDGGYRFFNGIYLGSDVVAEITGCELAGGAGNMADLLRKEDDEYASFAAIDAVTNAEGKYTGGTFFGEKSAIQGKLAAGYGLQGNADGTWTVTANT